MYLSPYVEESLNSKVIKSFVPELRSRKCFSCFEIPLFYVYMLRTLWTFCVLVWIYPFHISVSWVWYIYIYLVPELDMSFMTWLRLGSTCIKETIRETAKNIGSISSGLFRRWKGLREHKASRKKKQGKKLNTENKKKKKCGAPRRKRKEKRRKTAQLQGKKKTGRKEKEKEGERKMKKKNRLQPAKSRKKSWKEKKKKKEGICSLWLSLINLWIEFK